MLRTGLRSKIVWVVVAMAAISLTAAAQVFYTQEADAQARLPNNSVRSENIVDGQVRTEDLADDAVRPNIQIVRGIGNQSPFPPNSSGGDRVDCPPGTILSGGGFVSGSFDTQVIRSFPVDEDTWQVDALNVGTGTTWVQAYALCMAPSP